MNDTPDDGPGRTDANAITCPQCDSPEVRPSRSSYPQDKEKIGSEAVSFWRCGNCGARFLGPFAVGSLEKRRQRTQLKDPKSTLDREVHFARKLKRWLFPVLVILATVVAVIYLLDKRDAPAEQIVDP